MPSSEIHLCRNAGLVCGCLLSLLNLLGCNTLTGDSKREPVKGLDTRLMRADGYSFDERGAQRTLPPSDGRPSIVMDVRDGKRHIERIPLSPEKPTYIQDIVDDAKLLDKIGKIQVVLLRPTGGNSPPIRMPADFDGETNRIVIGQNYALQANDQLIVAKDNRSWLEGLLKK
jgi:hypothetical protein